MSAVGVMVGDDPSDGAAPAVPASDPASGAPSNDVETVEPEPAREYLIPFVPDYYLVTDSQPVSVNPTDSEAETTPLKPPAPSKTDPYAYEVPAASTGASGSMDRSSQGCPAATPACSDPVGQVRVEKNKKKL